LSRGIWSVLLAVGCASRFALEAEHAQLKKEVADAQARQRCAPKELALAEANLAFVELEFEQGDPRRAGDHLLEGLAASKVAAACPARPVEQPKAEPVKTVVATSGTDTDGDGVPDAEDVCITVPEDLDGFKDSDGCPDVDDDGDGVMDGVDRCPRDAEDRDGFMDQDGCPDPDNDGDGVPDAQDACPNEPGSPSSMGCAVRDRDGDGIPDTADQCPDQPETVNGYLDQDGCADNKPSRVEVTEKAIVIKQRINFATGKAIILPDSFPVLDEVAQAMKDYPKIKVEIGGHTDNVGDDTQNQRLSKNRADSVFEYLLSKGVPGPRMVTIGYGETRPIDTNMTEVGRQTNRRVEFNIVEGGLDQARPESPRPPPPAAPAPAPAPLPW
jgi:outer membrane protein OmpA-like peptidoglycan-associated protein